MWPGYARGNPAALFATLFDLDDIELIDCAFLRLPRVPSVFTLQGKASEAPLQHGSRNGKQHDRDELMRRNFPRRNRIATSAEPDPECWLAPVLGMDAAISRRVWRWVVGGFV